MNPTYDFAEAGPRVFGVRQTWLDAVAEHIRVNGIGHDDLLFPTKAGTPISRNTFRTRIWLPTVKASGVDFPVRVHDLRHAHASWLLAGGADLMSVMERDGTRPYSDHPEIPPHPPRHRPTQPRRPHPNPEPAAVIAAVSCTAFPGRW